VRETRLLRSLRQRAPDGPDPGCDAQRLTRGPQTPP